MPYTHISETINRHGFNAVLRDIQQQDCESELQQKRDNVSFWAREVKRMEGWGVEAFILQAKANLDSAKELLADAEEEYRELYDAD